MDGRRPASRVDSFLLSRNWLLSASRAIFFPLLVFNDESKSIPLEQRDPELSQGYVRPNWVSRKEGLPSTLI